MAIIGVNARIELQASLGSNLTITGITKANPGVVTSTAHGLSNGDVVVLNISDGMVELDGQAARVASVTTDTFALEGINTTSYTTFTAGVANEVATWMTFASAQSISMPDAAPNKIPAKTLLDKVAKYVYGLPEAPDGTITHIFTPGATAEAAIATATDAKTPLVFRITYAAGEVSIFNANVSGGSGFDMPDGGLATSTVSFTPVGLVKHFAS